METKEITAIAIKFLAMWLLVQIILQVPIFVFGINGFEGFAPNGSGRVFYITVIASYLVIGSLAAYFLYQLANSILTSIPSVNVSDNSNISREFLIQLGGVYFIVSGVVFFFNLLINSIYHSTILLNMCGALFELAVGLSMVVKSTLWVLWLNKLRGRR